MVPTCGVCFGDQQLVSEMDKIWVSVVATMEKDVYCEELEAS